jgi:hypothetical protein
MVEHIESIGWTLALICAAAGLIVIAAFDDSSASALAAGLAIGPHALKGSEHHRTRAEVFRMHADNARLPGTREMYLRLAHKEEVLAEHALQNEEAPAKEAEPTASPTSAP